MSSQTQLKSSRAARLEDARLNTGLSQRAVAERLKKAGLKISAASLSSYESDNAIQIKRPLLHKLAELYKTSVAYIETGQHPSPGVVEETRATYGKNIGLNEVNFVHPATLEEYLILPAVPVKARATFAEMVGSGSEYGDLDTMRAYNPSSELRKEGSIAIEIDGDSMEPQLRSGMWVGAYPLDPGNFKYASSGVYVVDYASSVVIKRVKHNDLLTNGTLTLHSDNERAGSVVIESQDIRRMWKVVDILAGRVV